MRSIIHDGEGRSSTNLGNQRDKSLTIGFSRACHNWNESTDVPAGQNDAIDSGISQQEQRQFAARRMICMPENESALDVSQLRLRLVEQELRSQELERQLRERDAIIESQQDELDALRLQLSDLRTRLVSAMQADQHSPEPARRWPFLPRHRARSDDE
jgi:hypothetical protein